MEHVITTAGSTYRVADAGEDVDDYLDWLCTTHGERAPLTAMSRQQVLARIGRRVLPTDFPEPDLIIGDPDREAGHTRGWFEPTVTAWEEHKLRAESESAAGGDVAPAAAVDEPTVVAAGKWGRGSRIWEGVGLAADDLAVIVTSRGVLTPSGVALSDGPMLDPSDLGRFLVYRWPTKPTRLPQLWVTYEALLALGFAPPEGEITTSESQADQVAAMFGATISNARSGWFTCTFRDVDDRKAHVVLMALMATDAATHRPGDMGLAGWEGTATVLPEDEMEAARTLAERIDWLVTLADDVLPSARWANCGAALLDSIRRRGARNKKVVPCPLPGGLIAEVGSHFEPVVDADWDGSDHKARAGRVDVEVDQRAAYLASAGSLYLGVGEPAALTSVDVEVFNEQRPPFGLWRLTAPPAASLDGLTRKLPLPVANMRWDEPATFWLTTRGVQQLMAPPERGGAGLDAGELDVTAGWVWPDQTRALRTWTDMLRTRLNEAVEAGREDYESFIKAIYQAYLGRMGGTKWEPSRQQHTQPAWYAAIRADTRWRAMRYARAIGDTYGLYPGQARNDAWFYRLPPDQDLTILTEESTSLGKYRVKQISDQQGVRL